MSSQKQQPELPFDNNLPIEQKNWKKVRFDQIAECINDKVDDPSKAGVDRYVGLEHLDPESLKIRRWGTPDDVEASKLRFKPGDIIFGKRRAYQRKLAIADFEGICSAHAMVLRPREEEVLKDFFPYFLQTDTFFERALSISIGSLSPTINWNTLAKQEFSIPPKDEQRRIADILWAADEAIEKAKGLIKAGNKLKSRFISEILVRGISHEKYVQSENRTIPAGWYVTNLGSLCNLSSGNGFTPQDWSNNGLPIIRIQNLNGSKEFNYFSGVPDEKWIVEEGDLLFAWAGVKGVSFGPCLWPGPRGVLNQHIYKIQPVENINKIWLYEVLKFLTKNIENIFVIKFFSMFYLI